MRLGALVLTGGASSRMRADKAQLLWDGVRAVDRCVALATAVGAEAIFTVGQDDLGHPHIRDDVPLGGPVGGIVKGGRALAAMGCRRALVLAVDAPTILPDDLADLLQGGDGAAFADFHLPLVFDPARLPPDVAPDLPVRRLIALLSLPQIACRPEQAARLRGANTANEREALLRTLSAMRNTSASG